MTMLEAESSPTIAQPWFKTCFDLTSSVLMNTSWVTSNNALKMSEHLYFVKVPNLSIYQHTKCTLLTFFFQPQ